MRWLFPRRQIALDPIRDQVHLISTFNNEGRKDRKGTLSTQCACDRATASLIVQDVLSCGAKPRDRVMVVGYDQIEVVVELAHHGFDEVTCQSTQIGLGLGNETADIIIAPALDRDPSCMTALERLERALNPNGLLFLGTSGALSPRLQRIRKFLKQRGFAFTRTHFDAVDLAVHRCRKTAAAVARAA
jgi:hypothetical protein